MDGLTAYGFVSVLLMLIFYAFGSRLLDAIVRIVKLLHSRFRWIAVWSVHYSVNLQKQLVC